MSKLVKSSQITIDKKKYILNNDFFIPKQIEVPIEEDVKDGVNVEEYKADLRTMKEDMLEAIKNERDQLLDGANEERDSIIQGAYDQADQIRNQTKKEGYEQGYQDGVVNGYGEAASFIDEALEIKASYQSKFDQIKETSEAEITGVIISTVEKILNKHIQDDYDLITGLVEKALVKCAFTTNLTLRIAPEDYDNAISIKKFTIHFNPSSVCISGF